MCILEENRSQRLGIFAFYDAYGIVDGYVKKLLEGLLPELSKLVIVINGGITFDSKQKLDRYTKNIFIRDNVGFDAGAYKDAFIKFLADENWEKWDEVVLFNDTFYAPIFPWRPVFDKMENQKEISFWGLSRYPGKRRNGEGLDYPSHIQSYFWVCRKKLILSHSFWKFWNTLEYPLSRRKATENFEIKLTTFFAQEKYTWMAYTDLFDNQIILQCEGSPYIDYACELLRELQFPVIKRKALTIINFYHAKRALDYIEKDTVYDEKLIYDHLQRLAYEDRIGTFNPVRLKEFYNKHKRIYIYGHGKIGKNVASYFEYRKWQYEGFIVSEKSSEEPNIFCYKEIEFRADDGIVLALGQKAFSEVYPQVKQSFCESQMFAPLRSVDCI